MWHGVENLPEGGFIAVSNHIGDADPVTLYLFLIEHGIYPSALGKRELFKIPILSWMLKSIGVIPVDRNTASARHALKGAKRALSRGSCVVIYPEGTHTHHPDLWPMKGKTGAVRLAMETGLPIVPIAQWGPHKFRHPHTKKLRMRPFDTHIAVGQPMFFSATASREETQGATDKVMMRVSELLGGIRDQPPPQVLFERCDHPSGESGVVDDDASAS